MNNEAIDLLILSDGRVLAHNLTPVMAAVLHALNPEDETMRLRTCPGQEGLASSSANSQDETPGTQSLTQPPSPQPC